MFQKQIKFFLITLYNVIKKNPIESMASGLGVIIGILEIQGVFFSTYSNNHRLLYFPIVFLLTNILHQNTQNNKWKWLYLIGGTCLLFLMILNINPNNNHYIVGLGSTILVYFCHKLYKSNKKFANNVVYIIIALFLASLLSGILNGLFLSIKTSINYLFDLKSSHKDMQYIAIVIWIGIFPILFLTFLDNKLKISPKNKFTEIIFNFILTPGMIFYIFIFYTYFFKIIIQWELPKGNVAYMVLGFGIGAYILKMLSYVFVKDYFKLLYKKLPYFIFPSLILFWIGTMYRINQYGFTEERIYLFLGGLYLSTTSLVLLSKKWGNFLYVSIGLIIILLVFNYIPFCSAKKLGLKSQEFRFEKSLKILGYTKIDSTIKIKILDKTIKNKNALNTLVSSFEYIYQQTNKKYVTQKYGINSTKQLAQIITNVNYTMLYPYHNNYNKVFDLYYTSNRIVNVVGYKTFNPIDSYKSKHEYWFSNKNDSLLIIYRKDGIIIFSANKDSLFLAQLKKVSLSLEHVLQRGNNSFTNKEKELFFSIETAKQKILLERYTFKKDSFKIKNIEPYAILLK